MQELNLLDVAELNCGENIFRFPPGFIHSVKNIDGRIVQNQSLPIKKTPKTKNQTTQTQKNTQKTPSKKTPKKTQLHERENESP